MSQSKKDEHSFHVSLNDAHYAAIADSLAINMTARHGPRDERVQTLVALSEAGDLIGGMNVVFHWRWAYIRHLWTAPESRRQGVASALLAKIEDLAREAQCIGLYIDTFDASVAGLYQSKGYEPLGEIPDFPPGSARRFLAKRVIPASA